MRALRSLLLVLSLSAPAVGAQAQVVRYELDPVHTRVMFAVSHAGFSNAIGTVSGSTGELWFDPADWSSARLAANVPLARVDLGDPGWNRAALARNLLDAEGHPAATFTSTRIEPIDAQRAAVFGTLTLHGVSQEVKLDVRLNAARRHPMPPFRQTIGFSASTTISRKAFGIDAWPGVIGDSVQLRIEAEGTRRHAGDGIGTPADASPSVDEGDVAPAPASSGRDDATEPEPEPQPEPRPETGQQAEPQTEPTP